MIGTATLLITWLASTLLMHAGVDALALRYLLSLGAILDRFVAQANSLPAAVRALLAPHWGARRARRESSAYAKSGGVRQRAAPACA